MPTGFESVENATVVTFLRCGTCGHGCARVGVPQMDTTLACPGCPRIETVAENYTIEDVRIVAEHPHEIDVLDDLNRTNSTRPPMRDVGGLTENDRRTILSIARGSTPAGIAATGNVSPSGARSRLARARTHVRELVERIDLSQEDYGGFEDLLRLLDMGVPA